MERSGALVRRSHQVQAREVATVFLLAGDDRGTIRVLFDGRGAFAVGARIVSGWLAIAVLRGLWRCLIPFL